MPRQGSEVVQETHSRTLEQTCRISLKSTLEHNNQVCGHRETNTNTTGILNSRALVYDNWIVVLCLCHKRYCHGRHMSSILEGTPCGCGLRVVTLKDTRSIISGQVKSRFDCDRPVNFSMDFLSILKLYQWIGSRWDGLHRWNSLFKLWRVAGCLVSQPNVPRIRYLTMAINTF